MLEFLAVIAVLIAFDLVAVRFGVDSRSHAQNDTTGGLR
jgi:hypothetical protein